MPDFTWPRKCISHAKLYQYLAIFFLKLKRFIVPRIRGPQAKYRHTRTRENKPAILWMERRTERHPIAILDLLLPTMCARSARMWAIFSPVLSITISFSPLSIFTLIHRDCLAICSSSCGVSSPIIFISLTILSLFRPSIPCVSPSSFLYHPWCSILFFLWPDFADPTIFAKKEQVKPACLYLEASCGEREWKKSACSWILLLSLFFSSWRGKWTFLEQFCLFLSKQKYCRFAKKIESWLSSGLENYHFILITVSKPLMHYYTTTTKTTMARITRFLRPFFEVDDRPLDPRRLHDWAQDSRCWLQSGRKKLSTCTGCFLSSPHTPFWIHNNFFWQNP